jgi:hypothetical protein
MNSRRFHSPWAEQGNFHRKRKVNERRFRPQVKMLVLLGEVGGVEEYEVCEALKTKRINKPIVAWCIGTCASENSSFVSRLTNLSEPVKITLHLLLGRSCSLKPNYPGVASVL